MNTCKFVTNKEEYQGIQDPPNRDDIIDSSDEERAANSSGHYIGAEVMLPDRKGEKLIVKVRRRHLVDRGGLTDREDNTEDGNLVSVDRSEVLMYILKRVSHFLSSPREGEG